MKAESTHRPKQKAQRFSVDPESSAKWIKELLHGKRPTPENLEAIQLELGRKLLPFESEETCRYFGNLMLKAGIPYWEEEKIRAKRAEQLQAVWKVVKLIALLGALTWLVACP